MLEFMKLFWCAFIKAKFLNRWHHTQFISQSLDAHYCSQSDILFKKKEIILSKVSQNCLSNKFISIGIHIIETETKLELLNPQHILNACNLHICLSLFFFCKHWQKIGIGGEVFKIVTWSRSTRKTASDAVSNQTNTETASKANEITDIVTLIVNINYRHFRRRRWRRRDSLVQWATAPETSMILN